MFEGPEPETEPEETEPKIEQGMGLSSEAIRTDVPSKKEHPDTAKHWAKKEGGNIASTERTKGIDPDTQKVLVESAVLRALERRENKIVIAPDILDEIRENGTDATEPEVQEALDRLASRQDNSI